MSTAAGPGGPSSGSRSAGNPGLSSDLSPASTPFEDAALRGATVYPPAAPVSGATNPRSCVTCRRRKVRCDKTMPCANCRRAQIQCVFPGPGRAPRRPRPRDPNAPSRQQPSEREAELLGRLRKLEGIVDELSSQVHIETARHPSAASPNSPGMQSVHADGSPASSGIPGGGSSSVDAKSAATQSASHTAVARPHVDKQQGRMVLGSGGTSRYVSSGFWSRINDELDRLRSETQDLAGDDSDLSETESSPASFSQERSHSSHQSFVLGYRSADVDLRPLHPLPSQIPFIWHVYQENVDPIVKVLHVPTIDKMIRRLGKAPDSLTPSNEALIFAIYYSAITSMEEEETRSNFNADKDYLLSQYRFGLEQALAKANYLISPDLTVCQAFLIYIASVRKHDDWRYTWTLVGLLVRTCQSIGLHKDGNHFENLTPFETEMRRRLFWALATLDIRSAEDHGSEPLLGEGHYDAQLPLNINDVEIDQSSEHLPSPHQGFTDMTFSLVRYQLCAFVRKLRVSYMARSSTATPYDDARLLEENEELLAEYASRLETQYFAQCDDEDSPGFGVAIILVPVLVAKMTMMVYEPILFPGPGNDRLSDKRRTRLLVAATELFEYTYRFSTDPKSKHMRWLPETYTQWHAVAYVLLEATRRPWSATVERAWTALVTFLFSSIKPLDLEKKANDGAVWLPIRKLYHKVKKHREAELARLRADPAAARRLDQEIIETPLTFASLPASAGATARDTWRGLLNLSPAPVNDPPSQNQQRGPVPEGSDPSSRHADSALDELMDATLQSSLVPSQFLSFAFTTMGSGMSAAGTAAAPDTGLVSTGDAAVLSAGHELQPKKPPQPREAALAQMHEYPPPWMWQGSSADVGQPDTDVNMDDGFNWQEWQQSLGTGGPAWAGWGGL